MQLLLKETCIAELAHCILALSGIACFHIWKSVGSVLIFICNLLFNMVFIIIQRYNRPRLKKMISMLMAREKKIDTLVKRRDTDYACTDS